ncbi:hypothetical protein [Meiothermus sp. Pnk-1]|uniref:hypothetical protein n=1 Tax=Meiothermus sp. Pnk-1 TaxID=873128 RepID=UPI000D7C05E9|nr:hypothetical protein [Meiothermus sp. Pnk-1]PZA08310.1 hypothetical protein DNA98_04015 [Meiothermus sp. Pnk-1]
MTPRSTLTPAYLQNYILQGIPLEDSAGRPLDPAVLAGYIAQAEADYTRKFGVLYRPTRVVLGRVPEGRIPSTPPERIDRPGPDYEARAWQGDRWSILRLPYGPTREILYVGIGYGANGAQILEFSPQWYQPTPHRFNLRLFPGSTLLAQANLASYAAGLLAGSRSVVQGWRIAYIAGYTDILTEQPDLAHAIALRAAQKALPMLTMMAQGYISSESVSVDGLSQSRGYPVSAGKHLYSALADELKAQEEDFLGSFFQSRKGSRLLSV